MDPSGPYLQSALVCERVLQENDGVLSIIRVIDRVTFIVGPDGELVAPEHPVFFVITFKAGAARGTYSIEIRVEKPSGERSAILNAPVHFEGEERGANIVIGAAFAPDQAGLYWYEVLFEGERVTRMPLRAVYQPMATVGGP